MSWLEDKWKGGNHMHPLNLSQLDVTSLCQPSIVLFVYHSWTLKTRERFFFPSQRSLVPTHYEKFCVFAVIVILVGLLQKGG